MKEDAIKESVRDLLEVIQVLGDVTMGLQDVGIKPDSLVGLYEPLSDVICRLYDFPLPPGQSSVNVHRIIVDFSNGEFEIDECLDRLALFVTSTH